MTRGERVIAFIEAYCKVPEGKLVGKPLKLEQFQKKFILAVYDNPDLTRRAILSMARKNGKTGLIAALLLAHICGPEAVQNSQIRSGAMSREQAALVFELAVKMISLSPELGEVTRIVPSGKRIIGLVRNVDYKALAAEGTTAHGLSPVLAILDEVGQVRGPYSAFVEAIETAQGAYQNPLLIVISTQAPTDGDLLSIWIDDALASDDPRTICHLHAAEEDCELTDEQAWAAANPALGSFRSREDVEEFAKRAERQPSSENTFRWLYLNQRVEATAPFVSKSVWMDCAGDADFGPDAQVYAGLDLSSARDLTSLVLVAVDGGKKFVRPFFWLPADGLAEKSRSDRVPYDVWEREGHLLTTPGRAIDYDYVAEFVFSQFEEHNIKKIAFDRWNYRHFRPCLARAGFREDDLEGEDAVFAPFGQGFASMSPALRDLETDLLDGVLVHPSNPALNMCAGNAVLTTDAAGNRKLDKAKASGRIDGMVALAMAHAVASTALEDGPSVYADRGVIAI